MGKTYSLMRKYNLFIDIAIIVMVEPCLLQSMWEMLLGVSCQEHGLIFALGVAHGPPCGLVRSQLSEWWTYFYALYLSHSIFLLFYAFLYIIFDYFLTFITFMLISLVISWVVLIIGWNTMCMLCLLRVSKYSYLVIHVQTQDNFFF